MGEVAGSWGATRTDYADGFCCAIFVGKIEELEAIMVRVRDHEMLNTNGDAVWVMEGPGPKVLTMWAGIARRGRGVQWQAKCAALLIRCTDVKLPHWTTRIGHVKLVISKGQGGTASPLGLASVDKAQGPQGVIFGNSQVHQLTERIVVNPKLAFVAWATVPIDRPEGIYVYRVLTRVGVGGRTVLQLRERPLPTLFFSKFPTRIERLNLQCPRATWIGRKVQICH